MLREIRRRTIFIFDRGEVCLAPGVGAPARSSNTNLISITTLVLVRFTDFLNTYDVFCVAYILA
jgi:hypothetical protein